MTIYNRAAFMAATCLFAIPAAAFAVPQLPQGKPNFVTSATKAPLVVGNPRLPLAQGVEVTTSSGHMTYRFILAVGQTSTPIVIPANVPVRITGVSLQLGDRGIGDASLLRINNSFIEWTGQDVYPAYNTSAPLVENGFSGAAGTHIVWLDYGGTVDVQVADTNHIQIVNSSGGEGTTTVQLDVDY